jgi:hypothetical protein
LKKKLKRGGAVEVLSFFIMCFCFYLFPTISFGVCGACLKTRILRETALYLKKLNSYKKSANQLLYYLSPFATAPPSYHLLLQYLNTDYYSCSENWST